MATNKKMNIYVFMFLITLVSSLFLSITESNLKESISDNIEANRKKNVLECIGVDAKLLSQENVNQMYDKLISESVLNIDGGTSDLSISDLRIEENKTTGAMTYLSNNIEYLPIFISEKKNATIFPISGKGLWSTLYGYIALEGDLNSILGITFYKHKETPGLGGEIEKEWFQNNFIGKKIFDLNDNFSSVKVAKGKSGTNINAVDGITGATVTSNGVTKLLKYDLGRYMNYIENIRGTN